MENLHILKKSAARKVFEVRNEKLQDKHRRPSQNIEQYCMKSSPDEINHLKNRRALQNINKQVNRKINFWIILCTLDQTSLF